MWKLLYRTQVRDRQRPEKALSPVRECRELNIPSGYQVDSGKESWLSSPFTEDLKGRPLYWVGALGRGDQFALYLERHLLAE